MEPEGKISKTAFLVSWLLLMILTFALIWVGTSLMAPLPKNLLILFMMFLQAYLVMFYFMHLRFERFSLVLIVLSSILITTGILYSLIVWDGSSILKLSGHS